MNWQKLKFKMKKAKLKNILTLTIQHLAVNNQIVGCVTVQQWFSTGVPRNLRVL